jgi:hypothetical protein
MILPLLNLSLEVTLSFRHAFQSDPLAAVHISDYIFHWAELLKRLKLHQAANAPGRSSYEMLTPDIGDGWRGGDGTLFRHVPGGVWDPMGTPIRSQQQHKTADFKSASQAGAPNRGPHEDDNREIWTIRNFVATPGSTVLSVQCVHDVQYMAFLSLVCTLSA